MGRSLAESIAVIVRETRYEKLVGRWATPSAARFRLKFAHAHESERRRSATGQAKVMSPADEKTDFLAEAAFEEYQDEDSAYRNTIENIRRALDFGYPLKIINRQYLPTFDFRGCLLAVVVGQDGLVANAAKYVGKLPMVAVNPDPKRIDGILLPFHARQVRQIVQRVIDGKSKVRPVTLAEVTLNDGQRMLAFNDFFIGCNSHVSARYTLRCGKRAEAQSSSGMIVATGAGSTGWLSSLFNMVEGFNVWLGGNRPTRVRLDWEDRRLVWAVREPFKSKATAASLVAGFLNEGQELTVESLMPTNGVIFSDGVEADFLEFNSGAIARFTVARQRAQLVVG
jgi:NAD kinase